jgi:uncharacterized metal-binding protein YceD (DUF177 family)
MKSLSEYNIKFEGLKQGTHFFEFDVDNMFFEEFDCFDYKDSGIAVGLEFEKQSTIMVLTFDFFGTVTVPCDRCLDDVEVEISGEEKLVVKFGNEEYDDTDEILMLPIHEYELNVAKYIYEFINVNIPQKKAHDVGLCDQGVIDKLEEVAPAINEIENEIDVDPRWASLQDIKLNKNK